MLHISLSPNVEKKDVVRAVLVFLSCWKWSNGSALLKLRDALEKYFNASVYLTNSGRSALFVILKALDIQKGDEVIVQAFSCNAVANPILWVGAKPVYADIEEFSYNISASDVRKKITPKTKAIIIQHSFGIVGDISAIRKVARERNVYVIEDVAHSLGATYNDKPVGSYGDVAFLSFGRDKVISSVYGGAIIAKKSHKKRVEKVYDEECQSPSRAWVAQQLLHIIITPVLLKLYPFIIGKVGLVVLQKLGALSLAVSGREKKGGRPSYFPATLPNGLAEIALGQFRRLEYFNKHRQRIAKLYMKGLSENKKVILPIVKEGDILLRYTIQCRDSRKIIQEAKANNIVLGDWYKNVIDPVGTDMRKMQYKKGDCPVAEAVASKVINLPTHIHTTKEDAETIITMINSYYDS